MLRLTVSLFIGSNFFAEKEKRQKPPEAALSLQ